MSNNFSNIMLSLSLGASLLLASCGKKDNTNNAVDIASQDVSPSQEVKNIITVDKPYVSQDLSIEASTESKKSLVLQT